MVPNTGRSHRIARAVTFMAVGALCSTGHAATEPASITDFDSNPGPVVFAAKATSWRDPAFGNLGWTHSSQWGAVHAKKGQMVTIEITSQEAGLHPGCSVWRRDVLDTAPDSYMVDHFYPQQDGMYKIGATSEVTGESLGNIIMPKVAYGYDQDGNSATVRKLNGITDGVPGKLVLKFKAPERALYQFVVGGFNPDEGVATAVKHNMEVSVTVGRP